MQDYGPWQQAVWVTSLSSTISGQFCDFISIVYLLQTLSGLKGLAGQQIRRFTVHMADMAEMLLEVFCEVQRDLPIARLYASTV